VITDVPGVRVGHWTDPVARTGCTVVLFPSGTVASAEVRGGAPASRELAALDPARLVDRVDAVVLTGGSAFGLASADGVVAWCEERGLGFPTGAGPVPIVAALGLFDLLEGDGSVRPGPAEGRAACEAAAAGPVAVGRVGAGTGCLVAKWAGREHARPGGLGSATVTASLDGVHVVVSALMAVNAVGDRRGAGGDVRLPVAPVAGFAAPGTNTTIGVVATNARLTKLDCHLAAQSGHDGFARALDPVHTAGDGDALVVAATGDVDAAGAAGLVRTLAAVAVERAILDALDRAADPADSGDPAEHR
jgi:L-aminopeptidase/D-esterase-like protein